MEVDYMKVAGDLLKNNIDKIFNGIIGVGTKAYRGNLVKSKKAFVNYLDSSAKKYSKVKTILYRDEPVSLQKFYVDPRVMYKNQVLKNSNARSLLNKSNYLIFTGTAGAGKSTFLKHLFLEILQLGEFIPVVIELKELNDSEHAIIDYVHETIKRFGFELDKNYLEKALEIGSFVFLFDGFDELHEGKRDKISKELQFLADHYHNNHFIITSRPDLDLLSWEKFSVLKIMKLPKYKALQLIEKIEYDNEVKSRFMIDLDRTLYEEHESFASNPLLLTIMLMTYNQFAEIPEKIHIFYDQAFDTLYSKHDATKSGYKRIMQSGLAKDDFKKVLSCFSFLSNFNGDFSFSESRISEYMDKSSRLTHVKFEVEPLLNDLLKSVCLLVQDGLVYTFSHRTFQEYFAVLYALTLNDKHVNVVLRQFLKRYNQDNTLHIFFEIDKIKTEEHLIIPILKQLKELTGYSEVSIVESYKKYLELIFTDVSIRIIDDEERVGGEDRFGVYFSSRFNSKDDSDLSTLFSNLFELITQKYDPPCEYFELNAGALPNEELGAKFLRDSDEIEFRLKEVLSDEVLFGEILGDGGYFYNVYVQSMYLLDILEKSHRLRSESIFDILTDFND